MELGDLLDRDLTPEVKVPVLTSIAASRRLDVAERAVTSAQAALDRARKSEADMLEQPKSERAEADLSEAEAEADEAREFARGFLVDFAFTPVGSAFFRKLENANRASQKQKEQHGKDVPFDLDRFPVVLVAFCLTSPSVPAAELDAYREWLADGAKGVPPLPPTVVKLQEKLPESVWQQLWGAALNANVGVTKIPSSLSGSATTNGSVPKSEPPAS